MTDDSATPERRLPTPERNRTTARGLTWAGYLPFALLTLGYILPIGSLLDREFSLVLLITYGAAILSFLGGSRWGMAMARDDEASARELITAVVPSLIAWLSLTMPAAPGLVLLAVTFAWHYGWDRRAAAAGRLPDWYRELRWRITLAVVPTLLIAALAVAL